MAKKASLVGPPLPLVQWKLDMKHWQQQGWVAKSRSDLAVVISKTCGQAAPPKHARRCNMAVAMSTILPSLPPSPRSSLTPSG